MIGHADRAAADARLLPGAANAIERKSVEPMAAVTAPARSARSINRCCISSAKAPGRTRRCSPRCANWCCRRWSARADRGVDHRRHGLSQEGRALGRRGAPILRPARQAGQLPGGGHAVGGQSRASLPVAYRLYLPEEWAEDRRAEGRPASPRRIEFQTKPKIALEQIRAACAAGLAARRRADGWRLWHRRDAAHGDHARSG